MKTCIYCGEPLEAGALQCRQCGRPPLPAKRYNAIISISLVGLAILIALIYWSLSQLIWLPLARLIFYGVANVLGLDYTMLELPNQSFINAVWLVGGAILYLPIITYLVMRFGFKRSLVAVLVGPLPFAYMDAWSWAVTDKPGILQFSVVLLVSVIAGVLLNFLYLFLSTRWPARATIIQGWALQPAKARPVGVLGDRVTALPSAASPEVVEEFQEIKMAELPQNPASQVVEAKSGAAEPASVAEIEPKSIQPKPAPFEIMDADAEPAPELVPVARVKESAPPKLAAGIPTDSGETDETAPGQGLPVWVMVVGLALLIIVGIVLVSLALK